jgi:hypothetical protein
VTNHPLLFALLGSGERGLPWSAALPAILPCATTRFVRPGQADGIVVAGSLDDDGAFRQATGALLMGMPLLCTTPEKLHHSQIAELCRIATRSGSTLRFTEPIERRKDVHFMRRLLAGQDPLLRPRYIRVLRLVSREGDLTLDQCLGQELGAATSLLKSLPERVHAVASHRDIERATALFLTLEYGDGLPYQCTISLAEGIDSRQVVAGTDGRPLVFNQGWPSNGAESDDSLALSDELAGFCNAVRFNDVSFGNAALWSHIAKLCSAARESLAPGGPVALASARPENQAKPPHLRLLQGGGHSRGRGRRPRLTLVAG